MTLPTIPTFKERYRDFSELVREHSIIRADNRKIKEGEPQGRMLLFAEAALILIIIERFLRMVLGDKAEDHHTLPRLLKNILKDNVLRLPIPEQDFIQKIFGVGFGRNDQRDGKMAARYPRSLFTNIGATKAPKR